MDASRLVQTLFGSAAIIGSGVLGFTLMTNTIVAQTNFNKQQCRIHDPSVQALAIDEPSAAECVCPPGSSARQLDDNQRPAGAASTRDCFIQTPQQITNFNQPPATGPGPGPAVGPGPGPGPAVGPGPGPGPGPNAKGNNGWGNGGDPANPGTNKGNAEQVASKQDNTGSTGVANDGRPGRGGSPPREAR